MWRPISFAFVAFASTCAATLGSVRVCVSSSQTGTAIGSTYAALQDNPLYESNGSAFSNPLYDVKSQFACSPPTGYTFTGTPIGSNDSSLLACPIVNNTTGEQGFATYRNGSTQGTIFTSHASGKGDLKTDRKSGSIIYLDREGKDVMRTISPDGKIIGSIPSTDLLSSIRSCALSGDSKDVCYVGTPNGGATPSLYVATPSASTATITINGTSFGACAISAACIAWTDLDSAGNSVLITSPRDHASGLPTGKRMHKPFVITHELDFSMSNDGSQVAMCDGSSIYVESTSTGGVAVSGPPYPAAAALLPLVGVGTPLDGSTVTALSLSPQSYTSSDSELLFFATLANGETGIFATTVPEPTTLGLLAFALPLLRRRRVA